MKIPNISSLKIIPCQNPERFVPQRSYSPLILFKHFSVYEKGRGGNFLDVLYDVCDSLCNFRGLRVIKDKSNQVLAGYTYKLRTNKFDQKSMYIDSFARDKSAKTSIKTDTKMLMSKIFLDVKNQAKRFNAKELTLFVYAKDARLRVYYKKLGFQVDNKCNIEKLYLMRVSIGNFLSSRYCKAKIYANALGFDSILKTKPNF